METTLLYILKVNGLLVVFYFAYYVFLKKETFFQSNRWFLLLGIVSSFIFPLISFTNVIWIAQDPFVSNPTYTTPITSLQVEPIKEAFNWNILLLTCYIMVSFFFLAQLTIEVFSFFKMIKKGTKKKSDNIILVETNDSQNPFSFFNYLVFNQSQFSTEELHMILIHEKVHIQQKHSIDVVVVKLLCLLFWANPILWFYRKAILENLEYIADNQTTLLTNKAYEYQKTLLKTVINTNQLSITNQFYQSLIKKRIVMLNTNPSSKKKIWKYTLVLPFLIAFIFLFQIETIAQVKEKTIKESDYAYASEYYSIITSNSSDKELKELEKTFSDEKNKLKISNVKRSKSNEITSIKLSFDNGKTYNTVFERKSTEPINDIEIQIDSDKKNAKIAVFKELNSESFTEEEFEKENLEKSKYWVMDNMTKNGKEIILVINGKVKGKTEKVKLPPNEELGEMKEVPAKEFEKKYNIKADKNKYYYEVETVKVNSNNKLPTPPIPPSPHPYERLREAPAHPEFPEAPEYPSNTNDKNAMKKFEEKMVAFEMKMKKMEPQIQQYEKEMEKYEAEIQGLEPEMEAFEKKMEQFEREMESYQEKLMEKRSERIEERNQNREALVKTQREALEAQRIVLLSQKDAMKNKIEEEKEKRRVELARQKAKELKRN